MTRNLAFTWAIVLWTVAMATKFFTAVILNYPVDIVIYLELLDQGWNTPINPRK